MIKVIKKVAVLATAAAIVAAALTPLSVQAAGGVTQLEYLQWLVQLSGDTGQFSANSTGGDYVNWARTKGMNPNGGWKLNGKVSKDVLAQTLAQFLNLNPGKSQNYANVLKRLGINISEDPTRAELASIIDTGIQPRISLITNPSPTKGNNGVGNGEDPPPPGWIKNHPGRPQNDGPGSGPGNPGNKGGNR